jgi:hypothetical protein
MPLKISTAGLGSRRVCFFAGLSLAGAVSVMTNQKSDAANGITVDGNEYGVKQREKRIS